MNFVLSDHARKRCIRRRISLEWLQAVLNHPTRLESDTDDGCLVHALYAVPERAFRVLRVIYNETQEPAVIVTAYFDDEAKGV
jgi:hypothetical protein